MKKQTLLALFFISFLFTEAQAQDRCCLQTNNKGTSQSEKELKPISNDKMKTILAEEIKLFTDYVSQEFEYPELAKYNAIEGEMIVRVVYHKGFESIKITKSINSEIDKMVLDNISEYIKNFDRVYDGAPRLVFELPINFRMRG